jgi:hypothetical protein
MLKKRLPIFWLVLAVAVFVSVAYGLVTKVEEIQTAEHDSELTAAFIHIIPDPPSSASSKSKIRLRPIAANIAPERSTGDAAPTLDEESVVDSLIVPLLNEARRRRADLVQHDPDYLKRIDREINLGRINILLFGYGETHEPPLTEKAIIGSQTILAYDLRKRTIDIISFTHDIRAPEIERELIKRGQKPGAVRIDQAYNVGGFKLMRKVMENATGLAIDFQVTFRDSVMQGLIDNVFNGVIVDVPTTFDVHPFYLDGKKYDAGRFEQGKQKLNGRQVVQFIKTVPVSEGAYDPVLEHNSRKSLGFQAIVESLHQNYKDYQFWLKLSTFIGSEMISGSIVYDFDPVALIVNNIGNTTASLQRARAPASDAMTRSMPRIDRSKYIVDSAHGDGGVQWVNANAVDNPITQKDIDAGMYKPIDFEVPLNANPYGDLVTEYWASVRQLVKHSLSAPSTAIYNFPTP